jgi:hypothetical protein
VLWPIICEHEGKNAVDGKMESFGEESLEHRLALFLGGGGR